VSVFVYTSDAAFEQHLRDSLDCELTFCDSLDHVRFSANKSLVLLHRNSFADDALTRIITESSSLLLALADDQPSAQSMLNYTEQGVLAYCNSFMVKAHYSQMVALLQEGQSWFPPFLLQEIFSLARGQARSEQKAEAVLEDLTAREKEIAVSVSEGLSNKEVARELSITERTVKAHLSNIFEKLNVKDRMALTILLRE